MNENKYDGIVDIESKEYPILLKEINKPPERLYYRGKWNPELFKNCLAVVGARRMTRYGRNATDIIVSEIANVGVTIVSGFMYGVDAKAHEAALNAGGKTIAVMPCGIDYITPPYQKALYYRIIDNGGLIVSEYEPGKRPSPGMFVARNRIVAGLSQSTLVIEGTKKSGTMITAGLAMDYYRNLFAVPGPITSTLSEGPNHLIFHGAYPARSADDILHSYDLSSSKSSQISKNNQVYSKIEQLVLEELNKEPLEIDELARNLQLNPSESGGCISLLQVKGLIEEENGKFYLVS